MIGSLFAGISGLNANATALTVIGDNIANVNTTAFKSNSSSFANVLSQSLGGSVSNGIGRGVEYWGTSPSWTQGSLENTSSPTDLAINGKGFFVVEDDSGSAYYTRAGQFYLNEDGDMVNPDGMKVQGYEILSSGNLGSIVDINIPGERISPPNATTEFSFDINLDSGAATGDTYSTSQSIFDSLGNAIPLTLTFTKQAAAQTWQVAASVPSPNGPVTIGGAATATVTFDSSGNLTAPAADAAFSITMANGAATPLAVTWDLYDAGGTSLGDLTGFASQSSTTFQHQDGYTSGVLQGISVDEEGIVTATYSNGQLTPVFQLYLADFPSYDGLTKLGNNLYAESLKSGQPLPGVAGNGRLGGITSGSIEMSNVDLAQEFVKMITTQRAYQANSRVITTSDEILQELINIKR
jgi:flagellar hook protein FlgE